MMFTQDYKNELTQYIFDETHKTTQGFEQTANNIIYFIKSSSMFKVYGNNVSLWTDAINLWNVLDTENNIRDITKDYCKSGFTGLEDTVNKIENLFNKSTTLSNNNFKPVPCGNVSPQPDTGMNLVFERRDFAKGWNIDSSGNMKSGPCCGDPGDCGNKSCGSALCIDNTPYDNSEMQFNIHKVTVTAKIRALKAEYSMLDTELFLDQAFDAALREATEELQSPRTKYDYNMDMLDMIDKQILEAITYQEVEELSQLRTKTLELANQAYYQMRYSDKLTNQK